MRFNTTLKSSPVTAQVDGWVAPDGQWFPCEPCKHDYIAYQLCGYNGDKLEELGWVHISFGEICNQSGLELTQAQRDTLFDWQQVNPTSWRARAMDEWLAPEKFNEDWQ